MDLLFTGYFLTSLIHGAVIAGAPLLLAGLGEQVSEKSGVLNIGLEGMMLLGAYSGFVVTYYSGSFLLGFLAGGASGLLIALVIAFLCVRHGLNQIVTGIGVTIGSQGLTALLYFFQFYRSYPRLPAAPALPLPWLQALPILGQGLFAHNVMIYLAIALVPCLAWIYRSLPIGLHLTAAGINPAALDATGISVARTRTIALSCTGFLAGLGGACMANIGAGLFVPFLTGGAGFMAIVLAMIARGRPLWVLVGAGLFGASLSLATALQVIGLNIPTDLVQMLPFAAVLLMLILFARQSILPQTLGQPYVRGER